jgi:hypothetical protein
MSVLRLARISALLVVLVFVAGVTLQDAYQSTSWDTPLRVTVYPISADGREATRAFVASLGDSHYEAVERFFAREADRSGLNQPEPVAIRVGEPVSDLPPAPPASGSPLAVAAWSLRLRAWAWWTLRGQPGPRPQVRLFALFHDPAGVRAVPDSLGLRKGLIGIAHGFADARLSGPNGMVLAHELLHTLGATDKYEPSTNRPDWPDGYAEPDRQPLHPQQRAEIMAGRVPLSPDQAVLPDGLAEIVVGPVTAREIRWIP